MPQPAGRAEEFSDTAKRLGRLDDTVFTSRYKLTREQVRALRDAFATWPR